MDKRWVRLMTQQIQAAEVELVVEAGQAPRHARRRSCSMKAGDFIPLDLTPTVEAKVDGVPVMECRYGTLNGQYALRVERMIDQLAAKR